MEPILDEEELWEADLGDGIMEESDVEVDAIDGTLNEVPGADLSSQEDPEDQDLGTVSSGVGAGRSGGEKRKMKMNTNIEHNKKERERRKILKEAVTQLRKQLRRPTRKPVTIKVLEAAQEEIKELKALEKSSIEKWEAQKKRESHLQWKLDELKKELNKLPKCDLPPAAPPPPVHISMPSASSDAYNPINFTHQPMAPQISPPTPPLPASYIIARLPQAPPTPTLMNFPITTSITSPPTTLLQPRFAMYPHGTAFFQTSLFPAAQPLTATYPQLNQQTAHPAAQLPTATHPQLNQRTTHPIPPHSFTTSVGSSSIRPPPMSLPPYPLSNFTTSGMGPDSYMIRPPFLSTQLIRPPLPPGMSSLVSRRAFPSLLLPDHLYQTNPFGMPLVDIACKEPFFPGATLLSTPLHKTSAGDATSRNTPIPTLGFHRPNTSYPPHISPAHSMTSDATATALQENGEQIGTVRGRASTNDSPVLIPRSARRASSQSTAEMSQIDSEEENKSSCSHTERTSVSASQSLPDDDETDLNEDYTWGRTKRRRKKRNREGCRSSSDSESEGSCSSSQRGRLLGERSRNCTSRSSASGSDTSRRRSKGGKTKNKKCPSFTVNTLCCVPPLLKVSAAEFNCPLARDQRSESKDMELISECNITVSANTGYSPNKVYSQCPPCPTLERLPVQSIVNDSSASSTADSIQSPPPSSIELEVYDSGWTEAIIEKSMSNLKQKFAELNPPYLDLGRNNSNYIHPTKSVHSILLA